MMIHHKIKFIFTIFSEILKNVSFSIQIIKFYTKISIKKYISIKLMKFSKTWMIQNLRE